MEPPSMRMVRISPLMHHRRKPPRQSANAMLTPTASRRRLSQSAGRNLLSDIGNGDRDGFGRPLEPAGEDKVRRPAQAEGGPEVIPGQLLIEKQEGEGDKDPQCDYLL